MIHEQSRHGRPPAAPAPRAVPTRVDARGRRDPRTDHLDGLAADRGAGPRGRQRRWSSPTVAGCGSPRPDAGWPTTRSRSSPRSTPPGSTSIRTPSPRDGSGSAASPRRSAPRCCRSSRSWPRSHPEVEVVINEYEPLEALRPARRRRPRPRADLRLQPGAGLPRPRRSWPGRCGRRVGTRRCPADEAPDGAHRPTSRCWADRPWIVNSRNTADDDAVRTLASMAGFAPRISHRIDSLDLVEDLIVAGHGVGLLPLDRPTGAGVRVLPAGRPGGRDDGVRRDPARPRGLAAAAPRCSTG